MGKKVVTIDELIDMAIGVPESTVNFLILQKVLKLISKYCCKMNNEFEIDMDNMKAEISMIGNDSRSSFSESRGSYASNVDSEQSGRNNEYVEETKIEKDSESEHKVDLSRVKTESEDQEHATEDQKVSESGSEKQKQSESSERKDSGKVDDVREKEEKKKSHKDKSKKSSSEKHRKKSSENVRRKDSDGNKRRDSNSTKNKMQAFEGFTKSFENRTNELENHFKELTDRIESVTQTIATHLDEQHLAEINGEIDKLKKNMENTTDQCFEVTNTINDQSTQIQEILSTINNIQLRKVENEELIDLLSGKADHSFVNEKVSTRQFEEIIQELNDVINESTIQMGSIRQETNTSLDEIKQELLTRLLAEEFDTAKTKIYKELIKLTEQHALILAQQNEHVAAGAKMRNLNCFACNSDVVMLLEEETIPKFRGLKASLQPLEPLVGSKIMVGQNAPEWKNHQFKARDFTRTSKAFRFHSDVSYEKESYVKGKNGCMYKGNAGCDCVERMNDIARSKRVECCRMVEANNRKNISQTIAINSNTKIIDNTEIGDVKKSSTKINNSNDVSRKVSTDHQKGKSIVKIEADVQPTTEVPVKVEAPEEAQTTNILADPNITATENEIQTKSTDNTDTNAPVETNAIPENDTNTGVENPIDGNLIIKTEIVSDSAINKDVPIEANNVTDAEVEKQ